MQSAGRGRGRSRGRGARPPQDVGDPGRPGIVQPPRPRAECRPQAPMQQAAAGAMAPVPQPGAWRGQTVHHGPPGGMAQVPPVEGGAMAAAVSDPGKSLLYSGREQTVEAQTQEMAAAAGGGGNAGGPAQGAGRAAFRDRGESRSGLGSGASADVAAAERGMEALRVAGPGARRRGALLFMEPHTRPAHVADKTGTYGNQIALVSNLFKLNRTTNFHIYQYNVSFNPEVPSKMMRKSMLREHTDLLGGRLMFDGQMLFLPIRLEAEVTEMICVRRSDSARIRVTIQFTNEIPYTSPTCIQLYNIIFKRMLTQNQYRPIGRNYFNPDVAVRVPQHRLEVWPGFETSILHFETSTMLIADLSFKIVHSQTAYDVMSEIYRQGGPQARDLIYKKMVGQIVMTRYNNRTYKVSDINWNFNPTSKFRKSDSSEISYVDYYKTAYNIDIQDRRQPLLLSLPKARDRRRGQEEPLCLVPELCYLTGIPDEMRQDFRTMQDIAIHTRIGPNERVRRVKEFIEVLTSNPHSLKELNDWNLEFERDLLSIAGRHIPPESIKQADPQRTYKYREDTAEWSQEMRGQRLLNPVSLTRWILMYTQRDGAVARDFLANLQRVCPPMGMQCAQPECCELNNDRTGTFIQALKETVRPDVVIVVIVLPNNRKDRYDAIKTYCCIDNPVPSQVVLARTLQKRQMLMSVATKVAIQLNCKMGGEVWTLEIPLDNLMVIGIDTYHDSAKKGRSAGAFIASMNRTLTRYYSQCKLQESHEELLNSLRVFMQAALKNYHSVRGVLPNKVIVYRDGVGDGQLQAVHEHEINQLLECFKAIPNPDPAKQGVPYNPGLAVVVVKKRINSRFFTANGFQNPKPGSIIDTEATRPEWYDFFLVSQSVRQGTVSPTHYNVIHDTTGLRPDHMQRIAYKMCHLYYNWPGTIRVPAPCQYAHKMAFLVGQSLHKEPSLALANKLYYL